MKLLFILLFIFEITIAKVNILKKKLNSLWMRFFFTNMQDIDRLMVNGSLFKNGHNAL